jgi:hypothetical protein
LIRSGLIITTALLLAACGDSTGPVGATLEVVSGDAQVGMRGWQLELPVSVLVKDASGKVLRGVSVSFDGPPGFGRALPPTIETDGEGVATTRWALGTSATGAQTLRATSGSGEVEVHATALAPSEGDVLVVHGALGPLRAAILMAPPNTLESPMATTPSDTLIALPQMTSSARPLVVLGHDNRPALVTPSWTPGSDTVHVDLEPPIAIEIAFTITDGTYATRVTELEDQVQRMEEAWRDAGTGVTVGTVSFADMTSTGPTDRFSPGFCRLTPYLDRIEVEVLTTIDLGVYWGYSCATGRVFITGPNLSDSQGLYLLAHEVGHVFGLGHTLTGVMKPNGTEGSMTMGEAFLMNFASYSGLNTIFSARSDGEQRDCTYAPGLCVDQDYDLPEE